MEASARGIMRDVVWSILFSIAIAVLMVAILLLRSEPVSREVLIAYPTVGALLAHVASRTSPTVEEIAWLETGTIAAACIVVLAALVNLLLLDSLVREMSTGVAMSGTLAKQMSFISLPTISVLLWWALHRRLSRIRRRGLAASKESEVRLHANADGGHAAEPDKDRPSEAA